MRVALVVVVVGCGSAEPHGDAGPCADPGFIGDPDGTPEIEIGWMSPSVPYTRLEDAGNHPELFVPPEGGLEFVIVPRIHDMAGCEVETTARLRDPTSETEQVVFRETRRFRLLEDPERPGWSLPISWSEHWSYNSLQIFSCPNYSDRGAAGCEWILDVTAEDFEGRVAERRVRVVPTCSADGYSYGGTPEDTLAHCECWCSAMVGDAVPDCGDLTPWYDPPAPVCD